ncbi:hypothetical protein RRG08_066952 [Elysia crispata]|uniref:Uncharacterized protein n=1 Tax=Elysia crispata TaxID=231223 RepID=A0AAE1ANU5_9GAST|nr:hypothetical protein RRG08_066952 [Elysia crispata]
MTFLDVATPRTADGVALAELVLSAVKSSRHRALYYLAVMVGSSGHFSAWVSVAMMQEPRQSTRSGVGQVGNRDIE